MARKEIVLADKGYETRESYKASKILRPIP